MRTLPTLGVCGWLVAAAVLPTVCALECIAGGVAQAQQFDPPERCRLNLLQQPQLDLFQKWLSFRGCEGFVSIVERPAPLTPLTSSPSTSDWPDSLWLSSVTNYWPKQVVGKIQNLLQRPRRSSPGKGDFWKPGEFDHLIGG